MIRFDLHVFAGRFETEAAASKYAAETFDANVDSHCQLSSDIGVVRLNHDYVETIFGPSRHEYLTTLLVDPSCLLTIQQAEPSDTDTYFLVFGIESNRGLSFSEAPRRVSFLGTYKGAWK